jgi:predicted site-specific integrase-resolvase
MHATLPRLLTPRAVALWLDISREMVREMSLAGEIPGIRLPSGDYRYRESDLETWIQGRAEMPGHSQGESTHE